MVRGVVGGFLNWKNCGGVYSGVNRQGRSGSQRFLVHETLKRGGVVPAPSSVEDGGKVQGSGFKVQGTRLRTWQSAPANLTGFLPESGYRRQFSGGANATSRPSRLFCIGDVFYREFRVQDQPHRTTAKPLCNLTSHLFPIVELSIFVYASICPKDIT